MNFDAVKGLTGSGWVSEIEKRLHSQADRAVLERSVGTIPAYFILLLAIIWATPISSRFPKAMLWFAVFSLVLCIGRLWIVYGWRKSLQANAVKANESRWRQLFLISHYITAGAWGVFCCLTVAFLELGWTSFFVLLITIGICAASIPVLAPKLSLSKWHLILMFGPSLVATALIVGGLKGYALAAFFLGFFVLMLLQSKVQNMQYWGAIRDQARIRTMLDALPGTLSWISSDLKYLGVNRHLAKLWDISQNQFIGKEVGFSGKTNEVRDFVAEIFSSRHSQQSREINLDLSGDTRTYYMVASKYNQDTEAVVLGIDVTEYKKYHDELQALRKETVGNDELASFVELVENIADGIERLAQGPDSDTVRARLMRFSRALKRKTGGGLIDVNVAALMDDLVFLGEGTFGASGMALVVGDIPKDLAIKFDYRAILEVLRQILGGFTSAVRLEARKIEFGVEISIVSSGTELPASIHSKLPMLRRIIETRGGLLSLDTSQANTRFVISVPDEPTQPIKFV